MHTYMSTHMYLYTHHKHIQKKKKNKTVELPNSLNLSCVRRFHLTDQHSFRSTDAYDHSGRAKVGTEEVPPFIPIGIISRKMLRGLGLQVIGGAVLAAGSACSPSVWEGL